MSIESKIWRRIRQIPRGTLFIPSDFADEGSSEAIRISLFRLQKRDNIIRVAQGIYVRPKVSKLIGTLTPSAEEVAEFVARRDMIRTLPTGSYALNALGLSSQVPLNLVLLSDGSPRMIRVGKRFIRFKRTSPKNLVTKGKISRLVIQALKEIGNRKITDTQEKKILELLRKERVQDLRHDIKLAPVWIQQIMKKILNNGRGSVQLTERFRKETDF